MATMLKKSVKEQLIKESMEKHKLTREQAVKIVRSVEMQQEVLFERAIDKVFSKPTRSHIKSQVEYNNFDDMEEDATRRLQQEVVD